MIPKTIHYCWFGKKPLPEVVLFCMDSWKKHLPDYKIKRWDETNSPMNIKWVKDACFHQKYAFAADYVRFYSLFYEGGIYLDTDMHIVKSLDELLVNKAFLGFEDEWLISMGILGCSKEDLFVKECMNFYHKEKFNVVNPILITHLVTNLLRNKNPALNGQSNQNIDGLIIYKPEYFYPVHYTQEFSLKDLKTYIKADTFAIHLWNKSWSDEFQLLSQKKYDEGFRMAIARIKRSPFLPLKYYKKLIKFILFFLLKR